MKKLLTILLSIILVLALSACTINIGGVPQKEADESNTTVSNLEEEKATVAENKNENSTEKKEESKTESKEETKTETKEESKTESAPSSTTSSSSSSSSSSTSSKNDAVSSSSPLRRPVEEETKAEISRERAIEIALAKVGLSSSDVYALKAEYDKDEDNDDGGSSWEVEFKSNGYEYSYEINAVTEGIIDYEKERIDYDD